MKINKFYLNRLAEAKIKIMNFMFAHTLYYNNLGAWDLSNKETIEIFYNAAYSIDLYNKDREEYLQNEMNNNIDLKIIEFEF